MFNTRLSLRSRLFLAMILLVLLASIVIASITILRYKDEAQQYHRKRLLRKELAIKQHINYILKRTTYPISTENIPLIFKEKGKIFELSEVHHMPLNLYDLKGQLLIKSRQSFLRDSIKQEIPNLVIAKINETSNKRYLVSYENEGERYQSSYSYITDTKFKPLAILNLPYLQNDSLVKKDINAFLKNIVEVYILMLIVSIGIAYLLSNYITRSITTISEKIKKTRIDKQNKKINADNISGEIGLLVNAYNDMIDQLEESAVKLAVSERENAWREMAKQVAHEIKNPLTPMRLTIQSFQRKFDRNHPNIKEKLNEYSNTLIEQIDTMSSIASAFSDFAKMPARKDEILDLHEVVKVALDIFQEKGIVLTTPKEIISINFDRTQLIRVVTNLVKNALQAIPNSRNAEINITIIKNAHSATLTISDNGTGIESKNHSKIFEPNFTTKSSGMGLGLAMVKSILETYGGTIHFSSKLAKGTQFTIQIPLHK